MANAFIKSDKTKERARNVARYLSMLRESVRGLTDERAIMLQMRDGNGSADGHYDTVAAEFGIETGDFASANAAARAYFEELDSLIFKLTTDGSVTAVASAIAQAPAKLGI